LPGKDRPRNLSRKSSSRTRSLSRNARAGEALADFRVIIPLFGGRIHQSIEDIRRHIKKLIHPTVLKFDFESFRMLLVSNLCDFLGGNWDPTHFWSPLSGKRRFRQLARDSPSCRRLGGIGSTV